MTLLNCQYLYATELDKTMQNNIVPRFEKLFDFHNTFTISGDGKARIHSSAGSMRGTTIKIQLSLQHYNGNRWQTIRSWSSTSQSNYCELDKTYYVSKNNQYRMLANCYVYQDGRLVESKEYESNVEMY